MRYAYDHLDWRKALNELARNRSDRDWFHELMLHAAGDVEQVFRWLDRLSERDRQRSGLDPRQFEERLRQQGLISGQPGARRLSAKGEQQLRADNLERIFGPVRKGGAPGAHPFARGRGRGDPTGGVRPLAPGEDSSDMAWNASWQAMLRRGDGNLAADDLHAVERESASAVAVALLIDVSHSMTLYGEDRITPARRVALAIAELMRRAPHDTLDVFLFGDDVRAVPVGELSSITNGPFHTNTCEALRVARETLVRRPHPERRVLMITDGKPTALFTGPRRGDGTRELLVNSSYGLDPQIVTATLNEAARYPRAGIDLTVFMVASDPYLERFVARLVEVSRGRAFSATADDLERQMLSRLFGRR